MADAAYTFECHTAGDGYVWSYRLFRAAEPRGHVVALHGIQSHGGWYESSCEFLCRAGFTVSFLDRRGSGLNERDRGDAPSFRRLLDDIAEYLRWLRASDPGRPVFLLAISWGGKLAVALQRRHPGLVEGLVLQCPGLKAKVRPTHRQRLRILWARLTRPKKRFPIPLNDPALFTANPDGQKFIRDDPLALHEATARLLVESARLDGYLLVVRRHVRVPVLLLLAEHDRVIANSSVRRFVERCASADKQVIEYAGAHHTLEFEPEPRRWLEDVGRWLEAHVPPRPSA